VTVDFIVIGGGIAGLRAAITLGESGRVLVLTKAAPSESNTGYAQGGIAVVIGDDDSPSLHAADTIRAGDGLCDPAAVDVLVQAGPRYVSELLEWGTRFDRAPDGTLARGREAAHSVRRVLHAGDATGREIGRALWQRVSALEAVETVNHALVTDLLVDGGAVAGVTFLDEGGTRRQVRARATLLATGGAGQVYRETTNPPVATGDGVALAYHAGAGVADLEFVQFHPTALKVGGAPRFLMSEALRGEGARLVNGRGETFMTRYHADGDLAPRDVVARSIVRESARTGGPVFLSLAHLDAAYLAVRFPTIAEACRQNGLDLAHDPIPVGPAAHYVMGGVYTDDWGRTSLPGLFAAGEVACTGVHGANRLASNSLLEGLVFGARAAEAMTDAVPASPAGPRRAWRLLESTEASVSRRGRSHVPEPFDVRALMWESVGLFRTGSGLERAVHMLEARYADMRAERAAEDSTDVGWWRTFNLLTVARLIACAAVRRQESRGSHFREDFPERDDRRWNVHIVDTR
jgi:L-aspartate oxidase